MDQTENNYFEPCKNPRLDKDNIECDKTVDDPTVLGDPLAVSTGERVLSVGYNPLTGQRPTPCSRKVGSISRATSGWWARSRRT
jgi:hypothetical protein